jgi:diaminopimelate epimerase
MKMPFDKMQGLGNDFIVVDGTQVSYPLTPTIIDNLSRAKWGIGCDQLLLLEASDTDKADYIYRIFNADGTEVEQCGNGARCMALFVHRHQLLAKKTIRLKTRGGVIECELLENNLVAVQMGAVMCQDEPTEIDVSGIMYHYFLVDVGNPHAVIFVRDCIPEDWVELGETISTHAAFNHSNGVNVSFVWVNNSHDIDICVYERGVGPTWACGSGACAAVIAGRKQGILGAMVSVHQRGGKLTINCSDLSKGVEMIGPAQFVFSGECEV